MLIMQIAVAGTIAVLCVLVYATLSGEN